MPELAKPISASEPGTGGELSLAGLLDVARRNPGKALIFTYEGRDIRPGYHVTEVKSGAFSAIDCGANPESWNEVFVQLWDVQLEPDRRHMRADKFVAIMGKVQEQVAIPADAKLTFEVSDGIAAMQIFKAGIVAVDDDRVRVSLERRASSCKPRDRWLEQQASCRGPSPRAACCA